MLALVYTASLENHNWWLKPYSLNLNTKRYPSSRSPIELLSYIILLSTVQDQYVGLDNCCIPQDVSSFDGCLPFDDDRVPCLLGQMWVAMEHSVTCTAVHSASQWHCTMENKTIERSMYILTLVMCIMKWLPALLTLVGWVYRDRVNTQWWLCQ